MIFQRHSKRRLRWRWVILLLVMPALSGLAEVPAVMNYQGRAVVGTNAFDGTGQFKLALVNSDGSQVYWRNAVDANNDSEPDKSVSVRVTRGIYSIALGDRSLTNMASLPPDVFNNSSVYLRVWFNDGTNGFQRLIPDQRITSVGYAMVANTVADGGITLAKLNAALLDQWIALSNRVSAMESSARAGLTVVSTVMQDPELLAKGFLPFSSVPAPAWVNGASTDAPLARAAHTAVWTGQEMIVWGGTVSAEIYSNGGGTYRPELDVWGIVSRINAPAARTRHSAVWTGQEMIVWGGFSLSGFRNDGGRFDPVQQRWSAVSASGAPSARDGHVAVWTGKRMVVWGGRDAGGILQDGALYSPVGNEWATINAANTPAARVGATAVWTGDRLIVWGGSDASGPLGTGGQLLFDETGTPVEWRGLRIAGSPAPRSGHSAVWTGQEMIIWGGRGEEVFLNDGAAYDPIANSWEPFSSENAPVARSGHNAVWTGEEMIVFGGDTSSGATASAAAYNPKTKQWRALSNNGNPMARSAASAVWSGTELLVFGGQSNGQVLAALQRLNPQPTWYFYRQARKDQGPKTGESTLR